MNKTQKQQLDKTGERVIEQEYKQNKNEYFIYLCHIATYNQVLPLVKNKFVLEFGCGSGYGSHLISKACEHITAVDISTEAINFAQQNYSSKNLDFQVIENIEHSQMKFKDNSFDVVISFQVIEHIYDSFAYIDELHRVLKKNGTLIIVTPNKTTRLFSFQKPWNRYHVKEFDMSELSQLISSKFTITNQLYMTARKDLIKMEMQRTKTLRLIMLPFTLFFMPESLRVKCIAWIKKIKSKRVKKEKIEEYDFSTEDIWFSEKPENSINLLISAKKS